VCFRWKLNRGNGLSSWLRKLSIELEMYFGLARANQEVAVLLYRASRPVVPQSVRVTLSRAACT